MRCTCQTAAREARKAALEEAAAWCAEQRRAWVREARIGDVSRAGAKASAYSAVEAHMRALANSPEEAA